MVGLSIVLEAQKSGFSRENPQVLNKATLPISSSGGPAVSPLDLSNPFFSGSRFPIFKTPAFLDQCFLCKKKLLPDYDIYMYKGNKGFCSVECRQIFMDEEESIHNNYCSLAAAKPSSSSSSSSSSRAHKPTKNKARSFAY